MGGTILMVACGYNHGDEINAELLEIIMSMRNLEEVGPNINQADSFGRTPLHLACISGNLIAV